MQVFFVQKLNNLIYSNKLQKIAISLHARFFPMQNLITMIKIQKQQLVHWLLPLHNFIQQSQNSGSA